jgi:hypothetical protein
MGISARDGLAKGVGRGCVDGLVEVGVPLDHVQPDDGHHYQHQGTEQEAAVVRLPEEGYRWSCVPTLGDTRISQNCVKRTFSFGESNF